MIDGCVVADDLTGACDTGHAFAARGWSTRVILESSGDAGDADVLAVTTESRYESPRVAADRVRTAITSHPARMRYKKIDSTLRGNVTTEVSAALEAMTPTQESATPLAVVAPAAPAIGRTTACGYHLVAGTLLTAADATGDPSHVPETAHIPSLFEKAGLTVSPLSIENVALGVEGVRAHLNTVGEDVDIVVADATHEAHLRALASGARTVDRDTLYVGSAGLATHVDVAVADRPADSTVRGVDALFDPGNGANGILGVIGSTARATVLALEHLPDAIRVTVDTRTALENRSSEIERCVARVTDVLTREGRAIVTTGGGSSLDDTLDRGEQLGLSERETRRRIADVLASVSHLVIESHPPRALLLSGGDTAYTVLRGIGTSSISLTGEEIEAGIPIAVIDDGLAAGAGLITKAGGFGGRMTVINCLARLDDI